MSGPSDEYHRLTPELLLRAYSAGIFPMAESRTDPAVFWVDPEMRGILPLDAFHVSRRLRRTVRRNVFDVTVDQNFEEVIRSCAETANGRNETWINEEIIQAYIELHHQGIGHSIECRSDGQLAGGLYGIAMGGAFFGESMFSRKTDASKVALVHLVARLKLGGFRLLDIQFLNPHLERFGAIEIARDDYRRHLIEGLVSSADFHLDPASGELGAALEGVLQSNTQTS